MRINYENIEEIDNKEALRKAVMLKEQLDTRDKIKDKEKLDKKN